MTARRNKNKSGCVRTFFVVLAVIAICSLLVLFVSDALTAFDLEQEYQRAINQLHTVVPQVGATVEALLDGQSTVATDVLPTSTLPPTQVKQEQPVVPSGTPVPFVATATPVVLPTVAPTVDPCTVFTDAPQCK